MNESEHVRAEHVRTQEVRTEDVLPVLSRVSWGAILAGAFVALAIYALLSALGLALGITFSDRMQGETLAQGAGIWAVASLLIALFAGGCVTTKCTAGENKAEAMMYGVILWGVMFVMTLAVTGSVMSGGVNMAIGAANATGNFDQRIDWNRVGQQSKLSQDQIEQVRNALPSAAQAQAIGTEAAWWAVGGIVVSMLAAVAGALVGSGPTLVLRNAFLGRTVTRTYPS